MKKHRCIHDLCTDNKLRMLLGQALDEYHAAGKTIEKFEEDYDCTFIFDEINYEHYSGVSAVWFNNVSSKTAFILKYDL